MTQTTTYDYFTTGTRVGLPKRIVHADGRWEMFDYDSQGRMIWRAEGWLDGMHRPDDLTEEEWLDWAEMHQLLNSMVFSSPIEELLAGLLPGAYKAFRYEYPAGSGPVSLEVVYFPLNQSTNEVTRIYSKWSTGRFEEQRVAVPEAAWNDPSNQRTVKWFYTSGPDAGRPQAVLHPSGTAELYSYANLQTTVKAGQPNATEPPESIGEGTETTTATDTWGNVTSRTVKAIKDSQTTTTILSQETYTYLDPLHRSYERVDLANRKIEVHYDCCGLSSEVDADGVRTYHYYDALKRRVGTGRVVEVQGGEKIVRTMNILDPAGRVVQTQTFGTDNTALAPERFQYDVLGRLIKHTNTLGGITTYAETRNNYKLTRTTVHPDGGTRVEEYYRDGQLARVTGTAVQPARYEYGLDATEYSRFVKETKLNAAGQPTAEWTTTYQDGLGRTFKTVYAAPSLPYPYRQSWYNSRGQLWKERDPDHVYTLFTYNGNGEREYTFAMVQPPEAWCLAVQALTWKDVSEEAFKNPLYFDCLRDESTNRVSRVVHEVVPANETLPARLRADSYVWLEAVNSTPVSKRIARAETSTDGLQTWHTVWTDAADDNTASTTHTITAYDRAERRRTVTVAAPDLTQTVSVYQDGRLISVTHKDANGNQTSQTTFAYDVFARQSASTDARNGTTFMAYNDAGLITSHTAPALGNGEAPYVTSTEHDNMGRPLHVQHPDGARTASEYHPTGLLKRTTGSRTYPVEYNYDAQGRMNTMKTWQDHAGNAGTATTTWHYDPYRGWLQSKRYPDPSTGAESSSGTDYTYTPGGRLLTRTWARGVVAEYLYGFGLSGNEEDFNGNLQEGHGELLSVSYNDDTPTTTFTYDRLGRRQSAARADLHTTTFAYNDASQLLTEAHTAGILGGIAVNAAYNNSRQRTGLEVKLGTTTLHEAAYTHDLAGRLQAVSSGGYSATYAYQPNAALLDTVTFKNGQNTRLVTTRRYDRLNRLQTISSVASVSGSAVATLPTSFSYQYNRANQRTRTDVADGAYWIYQYDTLGQVVSGKKYWNDGTPVAGQQFEYGFDDIGNRVATKAGGDEFGNGLRPASYAPNRLNQYTERTVPGAFDVLGIANVQATVTVNNGAVYRRGEYFRKEVALANGSVPVWQAVEVRAQRTGYSDDVTSGHEFVAKTPEVFTHDADGNLIGDGRWTYTWDAENRLVRMETKQAAIDVGAPKQRLDFAYDYQGRRIRKAVQHWVSGAWSIALSNKFLYDGWNVVAELNATNNAVIRSYLWGLDLSGTPQGAGGVGGLLAISDTLSGAHFAGYDGNGNVAVLVNATHGAVSATYEYGPFGETIRVTGLMASANRFRFSTKYCDEETGLLYYGYRYYDPGTGRWLSRDPIGEDGGASLHSFNFNSPQQYIDPDGAAPVSPIRLAIMIANLVANQLVADSQDLRIIYDVNCPTGSAKYLLKEEKRKISRQAAVTVGHGLSTASQTVADTTVRTRTIETHGCCKGQGCLTKNTTAWTVTTHQPTHQDISSQINVNLQINDPHVWFKISATETTQDSERNRSCVESVTPASKLTFTEVCTGPWYNRTCKMTSGDTW